MNPSVNIGGRPVGQDHPVYIVAEVSANHEGSLERVLAIVAAAKASGADAVKVQTYTADTITLDSMEPPFLIGGDSPWSGQSLHQLYTKAAMPWEWQPQVKKACDELGMAFFSSPFDPSAVDFLERLDVPAFKVASCELVDIPLLERIARTGKPVILSTGMATLGEIDEAVSALRGAGCAQAVLLKCTAAYPALAGEANLRAIPMLSRAFGIPVGLSDHSMDLAVPVAAVTLGACLVEKHITLSRASGGPDSGFSLEPDEFAAMAAQARMAQTALGNPTVGPTPREAGNLSYRRSLFVVADIPAGAPLTGENVRSIRPANGLHPRHLPEVLGKRARTLLRRGTPLAWGMIE